MTPTKKLIEVALPLEAINKASAREKSIRHGHPSTLHLWWARRPLAAARAVIFAQMVDDPSSCPDLFPTEKAQEKERQRLFKIIEELVKWENTTNETVLAAARDEIWASWRRACQARSEWRAARKESLSTEEILRDEALFNPDKLPAFHDPFAGGGALPLEAQRLGLEAYASDLNPVAVLINKAMIEIPPRFAGMAPVNPEARQEKTLLAREWKGAQGLAEDVRYYGKWMRDEAEKRIGHLYPKVEVVREQDGSYRHATPDDVRAGRPRSQLTVIAWLWARTVKSPNPAFANVDVPLASTFMLSTKPGKEAYVEPVIENGGYRFTVKMGKPKDAERAKNGTKLSQGSFRCLMSNTPFRYAYIDDEANAGRMGARLMAIVAAGDRGRVYLNPLPEHEAVARQAQPTWKPDAPSRGTWASNAQGRRYGFRTFGDYFTPRQLVALTTFSDLVGEAMLRVKDDFLGARASRPQQPRPQKPFHRSKLPHLEAGAVAQHVTFRLADSFPADLLARLDAELRHLPADERDAERRQRIESALDQGHGACALRNPEIARTVCNALLHFDGTRYRLHEWVVMPNHVHVLFTPLDGNSLSSIVHSWKSFTAKEANRRLGTTGTFWQEDYFDRMIRSDRHFANAVEYVRMNPVKAGLVDRAEAFEFSSAWEGDWEGMRDGMRARRPRSQDDVPLRDLPAQAGGGTGATAYAEAVGVYLGIALSRLTDICNALCRWEVTKTQVRNLFGRQAIPMLWDFAENNVFGEAAGDYTISLGNMAKALDQMPAEGLGESRHADAQGQVTSIDKLVSTDPPYYDNIGYADLSDFFYVWLRRSLRPVFPELFATLAVPKAEELVATPYRHGSKQKAEVFFLDGMTQAMHRLAEQSHPAFPVTIYYAFKQSETETAEGTASTGWETFLDAVIRAGFGISGTWPMRTELSNRMIGAGTNALASSIVLVCRKRPATAPTATRREFVAALKAELPVALRHLQGLGAPLGARASRPPTNEETETLSLPGIAPVDLAQAAIGPGMAVYTRYAQVLDAQGKALSVREALALINQTLDEALAEQEGDFDADSRWALTWFDQHGFDQGEYGTAEQLSKSKNTSVAGMVEAGILESKRGKVRLLKPEELPADWDPATDPRLTAWEVVHHLIRVLASGGEGAAAGLVARLGAKAEVARELAYRLYTACERKKRAAEALAYNGLVQSWPEIVRLAREGGKPRAEQAVLFGETEE